MDTLFVELEWNNFLVLTAVAYFLNEWRSWMNEILQNMLERTTELMSGFIPNLLGALGILVIGWVVALFARSIVRGALKRTTFDNRIAEWASGGQPVAVERHVGTAVFWLVMLFVAMAMFQALNLPVVAEPLNALLSQLASFVPQLGGALILLFLAWAVATVLKKVVSGALRAVRIDERVGGEGDDAASTSVTSSLAEAVYWLVFLLFLPAILGTLALDGLLQPVQSLVDELLGFLPNILGAALILVVGWFMAKLVRRIVTNLLASIGVDGLAERTGVRDSLGTMRLSGLIGLIVYVLILLPVLIASLNALAIDAVTAPASDMLRSILNAIPALFGVAILIAIAYFVGRVVADLISKVLAGAGFDNILVTLGLAKAPAGGRKPSEVIGTLILVALMLFASIEAAGLLGFDVLGDLISRFLVLAGQVVLGLIIFSVGLFLANVAEGAVRASSTRQAGLLAVTARLSIVVLAGAMALSQMGLANDIINLAFGLMLSAVAVAAALAFGLGARDVAKRAVEDWAKGLKDD